MSVSAWHHVDFKKQPGAKRLHAYMVGSSLVSRLTSIGCVATADTLPAAAPHPQFSQNERTSPSNLPPALFPTLPLALPLSPPLVLELPGLACCSSWCASALRSALRCFACRVRRWKRGKRMDWFTLFFRHVGPTPANIPRTPASPRITRAEGKKPCNREGGGGRSAAPV